MFVYLNLCMKWTSAWQDQLCEHNVTFMLAVTVNVLILNFFNTLDPDQDRQNVNPDLSSNRLTLWWLSWKTFW